MIGRHIGQSQVRRDILFSLFLNPKARFYLRMIADLTRHNPSPISRELAMLAEETLVLRFEEGNQVYFQANWDHPARKEIVTVAQKDLADHGGKPPWEREPEPREGSGRGRPKASVVRNLHEREARLEKENARLKSENDQLLTALKGAQALIEEMPALAAQARNALEANRDKSSKPVQSPAAPWISGTSTPGEMIRYFCPHRDCRQEMEAPRAAIHQMGRCPKCQRTHAIPSASEH